MLVLLLFWTVRKNLWQKIVKSMHNFSLLPNTKVGWRELWVCRPTAAKTCLSNSCCRTIFTVLCLLRAFLGFCFSLHITSRGITASQGKFQKIHGVCRRTISWTQIHVYSLMHRSALPNSGTPTIAMQSIYIKENICFHNGNPAILISAFWVNTLVAIVNLYAIATRKCFNPSWGSFELVFTSTFLWIF